MTFHAFAEYLKYRWKAKGRHGTHSPFAYDFVESVLRDKKPIEKSGFEFPDEHLQKQWGVLVDRTMRYYGLKKLKLLRRDEGEYLNADALLLLDNEPGEWRAIAEKYFRMVKNNTVVFVSNIHKTPGHTDAWNELCGGRAVRLSIDLNKMGVLFFRKEFREKQHFVLK